ncbi:MAG: Trp family transcriptional regulator [bacterium]|nr:Trp family transcriptional regulator [bacterium]
MEIGKKREGIFWENIRKNPELLKSLLTTGEINNITERWAVIKMIKAGIGPSQISRELSISRQTISAVKRSLAEKTYKSYRERGKTERKKKVYSPTRAPKKKRPAGRAVRTKYGIVYSKI